MSKQTAQAPSLHPQNVLLGLIALRIVNALTIRTFFQPDEYFQALEPAWQIAFGNDSGAWITWEWRHQLRSSMFPGLFAAVYYITSLLSDICGATPSGRAELLIVAPKVLQAVFAALADYFTWRLAGKIFGSRAGETRVSLYLTILSPWQWFCSTRTLSNCLETTLTIAALYLWPWIWMNKGRQSGPKEKEREDNGVASSEADYSQSQTDKVQESSELTSSLLLAALACMLRPTNLLIWLCISIQTLYFTNKAQRVTLAWRSISSGTLVLAVSTISDRLYYHAWTLTSVRFLYFNIAQSLAVFYGANRPDYYLTEGIPLLLTTALPFAAVGLWKSSRHTLGASSHDIMRISSVTQSKGPDSATEASGSIARTLGVHAWTCILVPATLSLISHKEVRFLYPLLPLLHIQATRPLYAFFRPLIDSEPSTSSTKAILTRHGRPVVLALSILVLNFIIAVYTTQVHQRGVIDVLSFLRHEHETAMHDHQSNARPATTVGFLMPCHSTPWRSHLVYPDIHAWALTCEPPVNVPMGHERDVYLDEADVFYKDPAAWLQDNMVQRSESKAEQTEKSEIHQGEKFQRDWPQYLVLFEHLERTIGDDIMSMGYLRCWSGFNSHWHDDRRRTGNVVVWCKGKEASSK